ncbi:hypothetical protein RHMOL_Rhmol03G0110500 [Rhododendron molle]|uniref:Uncharacterized protein n=1 Tax=Rhododendron molle TaxID=49168 RepID=A0ACC0PFE0_RHOML|nr:hypothetical protein RHMOL_Rhmol03G0110500 [Rhododendron molle]
MKICQAMRRWHCSPNDSTNSLARKFGRRPSRRNHSRNEEKKDQFICYGCQKPRHIKTDCSSLSKEKRKVKDKGKKAMIAV